MAQRNITVEDRKSLYIEYYPRDCGWTEVDKPYHHNGTLTYCESDGSNDPRAVFRFTGVAVYYLLRLHHPENMYLGLDDETPVSVNLTSPTGDYIDSDVIWSATDLEYKDHILHVLPGEPSAKGLVYVNVDAFIYTVVEPIQFPSSTSSPESSSTSSASSTPKVNRLNVVAGVVGAAAAIMLAILAYFLWRKRVMKEKMQREMVPQNHGGITYTRSEKETTDDIPLFLSSPVPSSLLLHHPQQNYAYTVPSSPASPMTVLGRPLPDYSFPEPVLDPIMEREQPDHASLEPSAQVADPIMDREKLDHPSLEHSSQALDPVVDKPSSDKPNTG
jgi:hypothetical protein